MFKNNKGFTLVEMLIVLMIISVLIILIVPNLTGRTKNVHEKSCEALVTVVQAQVDAFHLETGRLPTSLDELVPDYIKEEQKECKNGGALTLNEGKITASIPNNE